MQPKPSPGSTLWAFLTIGLAIWAMYMLATGGGNSSDGSQERIWWEHQRFGGPIAPTTK